MHVFTTPVITAEKFRNDVILAKNCLKMSNGEKSKNSKEKLDACLYRLQSAVSDNEKLASLLMFAYLMKTDQTLVVDSQELWKAIDLNFLIRLFNSANTPEGCSKFIYKSLVLNILSSFTEHDLLYHPLVVANLSSIAEIAKISMHKPVKDDECSHVVDDCITILLVFSRKAEGCDYLLKSDIISPICKAIVQDPVSDRLFEIVKGVLFYMPQEAWSQNSSEFLEILLIYSNQFARSQELLKFSTCDKLLTILTSLSVVQSSVTNKEFPPAWKDEIKTGINEILQSRCQVEYKYTAIELTRVMVDQFGFSWTVDLKQDSVLDMSSCKFLLLTLSIIKTEVRLILESGQADSSPDILASCYIIIEKTIEFLICDKEQFSVEVILKIHSLLTETFDCVIQFLIQTSSIGDQKQCVERPIVTATVRVLCVWLSEETSALSDKITKVLPVLLKWAKLDQNDILVTSPRKGILPADDSTSYKILLYLLPPLCHLSADESFCTILIKEECHVLLAELFKQLWKGQKTADCPSHLITLCNIFLNFSVLQVMLVKTSQAFQEILDCIMVSIPKLSCSTLTAHIVLVGLIVFRHRFQSEEVQLEYTKEFISRCICLLKEVHLSLFTEEGCIIDWESTSELWFLSVQNLVACTKTIPLVKELVLNSCWPQDIREWIKHCKDDSSLFQELRTALLPLATME